MCEQNFVFNKNCHCLPKGRLSEAAHEMQGCSSQKNSRGGVGGGWGGLGWGVSCRVGWGLFCHAGVGWDMSCRGAQFQIQPQIKTWIFIIVYQKGDLVKQPMKSRDVLPKNVPGVGWGVSCRGGVGHTGVGWGMSYRGGMGHTGLGWGMSCRVVIYSCLLHSGSPYALCRIPMHPIQDPHSAPFRSVPHSGSPCTLFRIPVWPVQDPHSKPYTCNFHK